MDVVAKLLESGKTKDVKGLTALHLAAQMQLEEVAKLLLSTGKCDVNSRDADGCTPLHYAAENGENICPIGAMQALEHVHMALILETISKYHVYELHNYVV